MLELATFTPHAPFTPAPRDAYGSRTLTRPARAAVQRAAARRRAVVAADRRRSSDRADRRPRRRLPQARAVGAGDRPHDRRDPRAAAAARRRATTPTSCSAPTTASTWASGGCSRASRPHFDHDIRVPLIVVGPGVPAGASVQQLAANVDLRPTFQELAGAPIGAARRGPQPGAVPARPAAGELARRDADRAPRPEPAARRSGRAAPAPGQPAELRRAALRRRALRPVRRARAARPSTTTSRATRYERRNIYPSLSLGAQAALAARLARLRACSGGAVLPARPTPGRRVSPHAGDPDRRAQRP